MRDDRIQYPFIKKCTTLYVMVHLSYQLEGSEVKKHASGGSVKATSGGCQGGNTLSWAGQLLWVGGSTERGAIKMGIACLPDDFCLLLVNASVPILSCHPSIAPISASLSFRYELKITELIAITEASSFVDGAAPGLCASATCCRPPRTSGHKLFKKMCSDKISDCFFNPPNLFGFVSVFQSPC